MDPKNIELDGVPLTPPLASSVNASKTLDRNWVKVAFMVPSDEMDNANDIVNRYYTSASAKFTDTRLGCNIGINPKPQWTRYADIRSKGRVPGRFQVSLTNVSGNYGMGSAYSEGLDDPAQKIFLRFGVPQFNSLLNFLTNAFNREQIILARTGRAPSAWYSLFKAVGTAIAATTFPALTVAVFAGKAINWLVRRPSSKFFTLKPTMYLYWNMVNQLVMNHAVNTGIVPKIMADEAAQRMGRPYIIDKTRINDLATLMPDVFHNGNFDVVAMATKAQRMANAQFEYDYSKLGRDSATDFTGYVDRGNTTESTHSTYIADKEGKSTLMALFDHITKMGTYYIAEKGDAVQQEMNPRYTPDMEPPKKGETNPLMDHIRSMENYADAEFRDGASFAVFRVEHTGSVQESFGNSTAESDLAQKINGMSSQFREARFSIADGNVVGGFLGSVAGAVTDMAMGALDGVTLGFSGLISGLGGSGYIDIPKHWQSSSATLPRGNYKIRLISPYNNPISRMINIWIPFYMLLAGAMPRSTGKQTYTSPFYCQIFDRGRLQSKLAMIESLSVTRGTSNLPFDPWGQCLAIDVSFDVVDLSSIMHMPLSSGDLLDTDVTMDDDNITMDYLNVLAGMDLYSQIYAIPKAQLAATKILATLKHKALSPAFHTAMFKNALENGFINDITLGASGAIVSGLGGITRGNSALLDGSRQ